MTMFRPAKEVMKQIVLTLALFGVTMLATAAPHYNAIDLRALPGDVHGRAFGVNDHGDVVGSSYGSNRARAFLYRDGVMIDVDAAFPGLYSSATGINNRGEVLGYFAPTNGGRLQFFIWSNGVVRVFQFIDGHEVDQIYALNDTGLMTGAAWVNGAWEGFISDGNSFTVIPRLQTLYATYCGDINNSADAAGTGYIANFPHGVIYRDGTLIDLTVLANSGPSTAAAINDLGHIVGTMYPAVIGPNDSQFAYIYHFSRYGSRTWTFDEIPPFAGGAALIPTAVNNSDAVVGQGVKGGQSTGFLFTKGATYDLMTLIRTNPGLRVISNADDISNRGDIAGAAYTTNGELHALLLTPATGRRR
jgi:probable HAF family extracellular repeat protein